MQSQRRRAVRHLEGRRPLELVWPRSPYAQGPYGWILTSPRGTGSQEGGGAHGHVTGPSL